ncbi:hypothetical protein LJK88_21890 [Paenibacillus sp. P26]|nr:hypothetical protein LJK88_21890 [Paenibacillus sp. P26]UUZ95774.1 hypothetical protein LJK87_15975 [Paenibacillus sp. P25]
MSKHLTIIILLLFTVSCSSRQQENVTPNDEWMPLRTIAWDQVSEEEKKTITGDWKKAEVKEVNWKDVPMKTTTVEPERVFKVTFKTKNDGMVGPIGIYIDFTTKKIVGYDARK